MVNTILEICIYFYSVMDIVSVFRRGFGKISLQQATILSILFAIVLGVLYRFYPSRLNSLFLNPANFKVFGVMFITLIKMIVSPLIFSAVASSVLSDDSKGVGKLFFQCMITFIVMTVMAVVIGIVFTHFLAPGNGVSFVPDSSSISAAIQVESNAGMVSLQDFVLSFIPKNIFEAFRTDNFLQLVFVAMLFAMATIKTQPEVARPIISGIKSFAQIINNISRLITMLTPLAVFSVTFVLVGTQSTELIKSLGKLIFTIYLASFFLVYIMYTLVFVFILRLNPLKFFKKLFVAQLGGFLTASSSSVLPQTLSISSSGLGVPKPKADFIIPLGSVLNMNGGAVYVSVFTMFVAQVCGVQFTDMQYLMLVVLSTVGAMGTAPVPGSCLFVLAGVLSSMGLPIEFIAIAVSADRILDMCRTFTNVSGDSLSSVIIARLRGELDVKTYNS